MSEADNKKLLVFGASAVEEDGNKESPVAEPSSSATLPGAVDKKLLEAGPSSSSAVKAKVDKKEAVAAASGSSNPAISTRRRLKASRRIKKTDDLKPAKPLYDKNGIHIETGQDICDCSFRQCSGCFYECIKCGSTKCGPTCRINRKYTYDNIDYEATDIVKKFNDLFKKPE